MATEDGKLEIVPEQAIEVRETRSLFRLAPAADNDLSRTSRQVAIVAADTKDEARQIAFTHDVFARDWRDPHFRCLRKPGNVGNPRFRRRHLSLRAGGGRGPEACGEAQVTWNGRGSNSFSAHDRFAFPAA